MKSHLLLLFFIFYSISIFSQSKKLEYNSTNKNNFSTRIEKIENSRNDFENNINKILLENQQKINDQTISSISVQLDSASYSLTIFGILFSIAAIILGLYVTYIERKIVKISEENKELLTKNQNIKKEVENLNELIQKDINGLFLKIKREETLHILDRLINVPKDITNVSDSLLSRELLPDDFIKLKKAFLALPINDKDESADSFKHSYKSLFFQQFFDLTLLDIDLRIRMEKFIPYGISQSFENDIIFSSKSLISVLNKKGINEFSKEINEFFKGLSKYQFNKFSPVYNLFCENLRDKGLIFELFNEIKSIPENRIAKIEFGNSILKKFNQSEFTTEEKTLSEELKVLNELQLKEEEEVIKKKKEEQEKKVAERKKQIEEKHKNIQK
jgi:hypothetical protein